MEYIYFLLSMGKSKNLPYPSGLINDLLIIYIRIIGHSPIENSPYSLLPVNNLPIIVKIIWTIEFWIKKSSMVNSVEYAFSYIN